MTNEQRERLEDLFRIVVQTKEQHLINSGMSPEQVRQALDEFLSTAIETAVARRREKRGERNDN